LGEDESTQAKEIFGKLETSVNVELERFSDLVELIYDAALDSTLWTNVIERTCDYARGCAGGLGSFDLVRWQRPMNAAWGYDPQYQELYARYLEQSPLMSVILRQQIGDVASITDIVPREEWLKTPLYLECSKPQGIIDVIQVTLDRSATGFAAFAISRHESVGYADADTRQTLRLLFPHLRRALLIGKVIDVHKVEAATLADTMDGLSAGFFLVDAQGRVIHANTIGEEMLEMGTAVRRAGDRLALGDAKADQAWRHSLGILGNGEAELGGSGVAIPISQRDDPHIAHVLPLRAGARLQGGIAYSAAAALFVRRVALDRATALNAITTLYRLTPMEARVLGAIVEIGGVPSVAKAFSLSEGTIKTHLKRIFEKTGIRRQTDLASLVAGLTSPFERRS
jgi:DNA-binding CsgD family transcriptional regulator